MVMDAAVEDAVRASMPRRRGSEGAHQRGRVSLDVLLERWRKSF